jgi:hypothetical protein
MGQQAGKNNTEVRVTNTKRKRMKSIKISAPKN